MDAPEERSWTLSAPGFDPQAERGLEAAFAVSTGDFGVRAAVEEGSDASHPMLIVAGCFVPFDGPAKQTLLVLPDPAGIELEIDGGRTQLGSVETVEHTRTLDLRQGQVRRLWVFELAGRRWQLETTRLADAAEPDRHIHHLALRLTRGSAANVRLRFQKAPHPPADAVNEGGSGGAQLPTTLEPSTPVTARTTRRFTGGWAVSDTSATVAIKPGDEATVEAVTVLGDEPPADVGSTFDGMVERHRGVWSERWEDAAVSIGGHDGLQSALRFALYHTLSAAPVNEGRSSMGARNLSGEAYHGHVFWDTEIFLVPVLALTRPEAARSALLYRYRTLSAARARARSLGYDGALYAWESTDTGEERTPASVILPDGSLLRILNGEQEHHISAAVPYAVMLYWRATGDGAFMRDHGAEMMFECARFWNSRVTQTDDSFSIKKVIGPDEYHLGVDNDAYTNTMAAWTLNEAARLARAQNERGSAEMKALARPDEVAEWESTAARIARSTFHAPAVVEQFDGFFSLKNVDVAAYRRAGVPIDVAVGPEAIQDLRAVKQADVLMAAALAPDLWSEDALRRNFAYYEPLTAHTSSLSPPIHALLSAWLRDGERCVAYLDQTAAIDMGAGFRGAAGGVHLAALGGLWQAAVFGLAGFKFSEAEIAFDPFLPAPLTDLSFNLRWRGRRIAVQIDNGGALTVRNDGPPVSVRVNRQVRVVNAGALATFRFDPAITYWSAREGEESAR
jgi:trehalose/maltose hydrolase-like predicted phosphorylase